MPPSRAAAHRKRMAFLFRHPGAKQMKFEQPWRSNLFEVFQMSRVLIFGFGIKGAFHFTWHGALRGAFSDNEAGREAERGRRDAPH